MRPLQVEFVRRPSTGAWFWAMAALLLAALAIRDSWHAATLLLELQTVRREAASSAARVSAGSADLLQPRAPAAPPPYESDAAAIAAVAAFDTSGVLDAVEAVQVPGVRLTNLDVSAVEGSIRANLEVTELRDALRYVDQINVADSLRRWSIVGMQAGLASSPGTAAVVASIRAP